VKKKIQKAKYEAEAAASGRVSRQAVILDEHEKVPEENQRCIRVGVLGVPNAGKSQLVNTLVGAQVSAVSAKTTTTRVETLGAVTKVGLYKLNPVYP
jgi:GTP-binding protein Era